MDQSNAWETFTLQADFPVSAERLFKAWTDPDQVQDWWRPMEDVLVEARTDLRAGGELSYSFEKQAFRVSGVYQEVVPNRRLVFTWNWTFSDLNLPGEQFLLDLTFTDNDRGCVLNILQTGFADADMCAAHQKGWELALQQLRLYLSAGN